MTLRACLKLLSFMFKLRFQVLFCLKKSYHIDYLNSLFLFMARIVYSLILYILSPLIFAHLWHRGKKNAGYRQRLAERLGFYNQTSQQETIVFHCASLGEVIAATPLIKRYMERHPFLQVVITCNTPTGSEQIKHTFSDTVNHVYLPLDFPFAVKRFYRHFNPKLVVILETELWPNLIHYATKQHCKVLLLNARLSEKSAQGYQKVASFTQHIFKDIGYVAAHSQQDAERFIKLGVEPEKISVTGSIKFDIQLNEQTKQHAIDLKNTFKSHPFIWVAGSTHEGEDEIILRAHQALLAQQPHALLILVPRHPERFDRVAQLIADNNLTYLRRSQTSSFAEVKSQVVLGDTMGELQTLYGCADVAFIGGSLIPRGGHNPLEAAAFRCAIISGQHTFNFQQVYQGLYDHQACLQCENQTDLSEHLIQLNTQPERQQQLGHAAHQFVLANQGALSHSLDLIYKFLD